MYSSADNVLREGQKLSLSVQSNMLSSASLVASLACTFVHALEGVGLASLA